MNSSTFASYDGASTVTFATVQRLNEPNLGGTTWAAIINGGLLCTIDIAVDCAGDLLVTNINTKMIEHRAWGVGMVGAVLLAATVGLLGTPLAYSRYVLKAR